jgi:YidC/Oxa1 family membrane protein insertase
MTFPDILFTLLIFPIQGIIELFYYFFLHVFSDVGYAILGVSVTVSVCTLPLYFCAERWQKNERETQKRLAKDIAKIKTVFSGDEQYMMLTTFYRQNHYHPVYALRGSIGLLIQIPFFIAAYQYLSHNNLLAEGFYFIRDLSAPDGLFVVGGMAINILPIIMTIINCGAGAIYTKGFPLKDKIQLYAMALVFLVLLYNSPSGLVLYWTANNVFSLLKNILEKTKKSKQIIFVGLIALIAVLDIYMLFFHRADLPNRILAIAFFSCLCLIPLAPKAAASICIPERFLPLRVFIIACCVLFVLHGIVIPSSLIASSVEEFSFIDSVQTPYPYILRAALQSFGIFIVWPCMLYALFSKKVKQALTLFMLVISTLALANVFLVKENYGFLTNTFIFSDPKPFSANPANAVASVLVCILVPTLILFLYCKKRKYIVSLIQQILFVALVVFSIANLTSIKKGFGIVEANQVQNDNTLEEVYTLSDNGKNIIIIMIDCAVGGYIPYIFEERPDLLRTFSSFTWYPNTVSFSNHTAIGALPIYGGYEYTPTKINETLNKTLLEKQKEAYLLLPTLFADLDYSVTITDPTFDNHTMSNLSIFAEDSRIKAQNLNGKYSSLWSRKHGDIKTIKISSLIYKKMIRFAFFKSLPLFLRSFIYDGSDWLIINETEDGDITSMNINDYAYLDLLPDLTGVKDSGNTYSSIYVHLLHNPLYLEAPDYLLTNNVTDYGKSKLKNDARFHTNMATFIMLQKWFDYMKENNVYDNTRIILVSDHGRGDAPWDGNFDLPDGDALQLYNALLMVKDFGAKDSGKINRDDSFMTNADAALFALKDIYKEPVNPFTGNMLSADKDDAIKITTIGALSTYRHTKYGYMIGPNKWLSVRDNIFDPANWKQEFIERPR